MGLRLGFVVNPIAGIGGPAALKGSDEVALEAVDRGYGPTAPAKATRFLERLKRRAGGLDVRIFAAPGVLGSGIARAAGWKVGTLGPDLGVDDVFATDPSDTEAAAKEAVAAEMDLLVFVGGDGTARDIARTVGTELPVLGVPAGVKMFSECFAETPEEAADLVAELAVSSGEGPPLDAVDAEVLDLDEAAYRDGRMEVRHHATLRVPRSPRMQAGKCPTAPASGPEGAVEEVRSRMAAHPGAYYVLGSGSTLHRLKTALGIEGTLIGVDVVAGRSVEDGSIAWDAVAVDADAHRLEDLVKAARDDSRDVVLVLSPIGGQGFLIGRGTGQLTPAVVAATVPDRFWVVAGPDKLGTIEDGRLRVDTGDPALDARFPHHLRVITDLGREKVMPLGRGGA